MTSPLLLPSRSRRIEHVIALHCRDSPWPLIGNHSRHGYVIVRRDVQSIQQLAVGEVFVRLHVQQTGFRALLATAVEPLPESSSWTRLLVQSALAGGIATQNLTLIVSGLRRQAARGRRMR